MPASISPTDDAQRRRQLALAQQAAAARAASGAASSREADPSQVATLGLGNGTATPLSHREGEISGAAFLGANLLEIINHGGRLHYRHYLWALGGIDHFLLPGVMPEMLKSGPVADTLGFVAQASLLGSSMANLPKAMAQLDASMGASRGIGATLSAMTRAAPKVAAAAGATGGFDLLGACYSIAVPAMTLGALSSSAEYFSAHGTTRLLHSKLGRGAVLDAVAGAGFLAQLFLEGTPAGVFGAVLASAAQTVADVNNRGWLGTDEAPAAGPSR